MIKVFVVQKTGRGFLVKGRQVGGPSTLDMAAVNSMEDAPPVHQKAIQTPLSTAITHRRLFGYEKKWPSY